MADPDTAKAATQTQSSQEPSIVETAQQRPPAPAAALPQPAAKGWRFWAIFPPLSIATLLVGLDSTVGSSALPKITAELDAGDNYVWILNGYLLTSTAFLPLYGQLAQVFGRRWPTIAAVAVFALGGGISGGASSAAMLIAGRLVQGMGGAGITAMTQLIISDLVSVRERGKYIGIVYAVFGAGTAIGPPVGGVIAQYTTWRWIFFLNLPICGGTLLMQFLFLNIVFTKRLSVRAKLRQIDRVGNLLLGAAVVAILIALSWSNTRYPWSSWRIILPLVLGVVGIALFHAFEAHVTKLVSRTTQPTIPPFMFNNRTSAAGLALTFLQSMLTMWRVYFLPVYFQAVLLASPSRSGVLLLPTILIGIPAAIVSGQVLARYGKYKPIHFAGFAVATLATGLYIDLDAQSSLAKIVIYQILAGAGGGCLLTTMLPSVQASHPQTAVAPATATWAFMRAFGNVWGIAIPAAIFNNQFGARAGAISSPDVRAFLGAGDAYSRVSAEYIAALPPQVQAEVQDAYLGSLRVVWIVCVAFSGLGLLLVFVEKEIKLRTTLQSDYKLKEAKKAADAEKSGAGAGAREAVVE
ncbi:major facilitator superfamily domain-containing protein [Cercophora scortea]|uniref:Major facilitator superfamily domain-containing protein n=1 Tax=Cercophora scortea TaxID=314031 RepID=A0AAE0MHC2_9PEZI|nr:major facilitator superfamily domain-containing protein [Cercophora scortea]